MALDRFFAEYRAASGLPHRPHERAHARRDYRAQAERTIRPALGTLKIADVDSPRYRARRRASAPRVQRNRTLGAGVSRLFNLFEAWEYRPQHIPTPPAALRSSPRGTARPRRWRRPKWQALVGGARRRCDDVHPAPVAAIRFAVDDRPGASARSVGASSGNTSHPETGSDRFAGHEDRPARP